MNNAIDFLVLPREISTFERRYLERLNKIALVFFALHLPVFALLAHFNGINVGITLLLSGAALFGPVVAYWTVNNPRTISLVMGSAAMFFGGILVHVGQGPVQIEMHFYFFALLAMVAVFGNPMVVVAAAVTVTLHHLVVWYLFPRSVFNYDAAWWVVGVHAIFVVLVSVASCFIARSFFDNVIGLDKIVQSRTTALNEKNREMRLLLDNVRQGFLTIDRDGVLAEERSAAVDQWFGAPDAGVSWTSYLERISPAFAARTKLGWAEVVEGVMPLELTLEQLPHRLDFGGRRFQLDYRPIGTAEPFVQYLIVITDVTTDLIREESEIDRREAVAVFERFLVDRSGFETFFEDAGAIIEFLKGGTSADAKMVKRLIHTLKGNALLYGLQTVATLCDGLENFIEEEGRLPTTLEYEPLSQRWASLAGNVERWFLQRPRSIEIDDAQHAALRVAVEAGEPKAALLRRVDTLRLEPTVKRLRHFADQAQRIAGRLEKGNVRIALEDNDVRLDAAIWNPFWSVFIHAIRNAVDHGIETPDARLAAGKPQEGSLVLRTTEGSDDVSIEIQDDGRGIDWTAIAEKAQASGLPHTTREELGNALFVDGFTTASRVTELSGRGVGMGALLHGTQALGGFVTVNSTPGGGTTMRMTFPKSGSSRQSAAVSVT